MKIVLSLILVSFLISCSSTNKSGYQCYSSLTTYPKDALKNCVEGYVKMGFDVDEMGQPVNIYVIESEPGDTFDAVGISELSKWKYEKGKPSKGLTVQLDFKVIKAQR